MNTIAESIPTNAQWFVLSAVLNGANSLVMTNTLIVNTNSNVGANGMNGFVLGNDQAMQRVSRWCISEVLVYTNAVSTNDIRNLLLNYFQNKFNIDLE